jgi:glutamine amidotransferase
MCELLGICSVKPIPCNDILKEFFSHGIKNPDGWGLAYMSDNHLSVEKEPENAVKSRYLHERLKSRIITQTALGHIRYATIGNVEYVNCHPFTLADGNGRQWALMHNGTIFDYEPLNKYVFTQTGETDSERILMYFIDAINAAERQAESKLNPRQRFAVVNEIICDMSINNKLNLIFFDGELIYVHVNYKDSLYMCDDESSIIFSTIPLYNGTWMPIPFTQLLAFCHGKQVFEGTIHGNEFLDNDKDTGFLYQIYSGL